MKNVSEEIQLKRSIKIFVINLILFIILFGGSCAISFTVDKIATPDYKKDQFVSQASLGKYDSIEDLADALAEKYIDTYLSDIKDELILKGIDTNEFNYSSTKVSSIDYIIIRDDKEFRFSIACMNDKSMDGFHKDGKSNYVTIGDWFMYTYSSRLDEVFTRDELKEMAKVKLDEINYNYSGSTPSWSFNNRIYILVSSDKEVKEYKNRLDDIKTTDYEIYIVQSIDKYYNYDYAYRYAGDSDIHYNEK